MLYCSCKIRSLYQNRSDKIYAQKQKKEKSRPAPCKAGILSGLCMEQPEQPLTKNAGFAPWLDQEGGLHLKYINAKTILPKALIEELQNYVQAGYIYVPAKEERHRSWGEVSGYREELERRNKKIRMEYGQSISVEELACRYCLSISAIRKIIYHK